MPDIADERVLADAADPGQFVNVEMRLCWLLEGRGRNSVMDARDDAAVPRRAIHEIVGRLEPARARHVLHGNRGMAREMRGKEPGDQPAECVIDPARCAADDEADLLAGVEFVRGGGAGGGNRRQDRKGQSGRSGDERSARRHVQS